MRERPSVVVIGRAMMTELAAVSATAGSLTLPPLPSANTYPVGPRVEQLKREEEQREIGRRKTRQNKQPKNRAARRRIAKASRKRNRGNR